MKMHHQGMLLVLGCISAAMTIFLAHSLHAIDPSMHEMKSLSCHCHGLCHSPIHSMDTRSIPSSSRESLGKFCSPLHNPSEVPSPPPNSSGHVQLRWSMADRSNPKSTCCCCGPAARVFSSDAFDGVSGIKPLPAYDGDDTASSSDAHERLDSGDEEELLSAVVPWPPCGFFCCCVRSSISSTISLTDIFSGSGIRSEREEGEEGIVVVVGSELLVV